MVRFVLSPSVEAMKTSASSIPASRSASISSAVADREAPAGVLPGGVHPGVEALVRERVLVEDRDLVARGQHRARDRGPDAAGADDEHEGHRRGLYRAAPSSLAAAASLGVAPSPRAAVAVGAAGVGARQASPARPRRAAR